MPDTRFCWPPSVILTPEKWEEGGEEGEEGEITQHFNPFFFLEPKLLRVEWFTRAKTSPKLCRTFHTLTRLPLSIDQKNRTTNAHKDDNTITLTPSKLSSLSCIWGKSSVIWKQEGGWWPTKGADHEKVIIAANCHLQRMPECRQVALIYINAFLLIHSHLHTVAAISWN